MAEKAGPHFAQISNDCLLGLKNAIEFQMPASVKEKKTKVKQYKHAKDNAISALGKVIKYQSGVVDVHSLIPNWLGLLPIKADVEEAKLQNEFLAQLLIENPAVVLGQDYQRFEQVVILLSDIANKKYLNDETAPKIATIIQNMAADGTFGPRFQLIYQNKLTVEQQERLNNAPKLAQ